ncbi:MAG: 4Fe-4S dicluster domain-containing protein [Trueperaceae bacterium]|nr:MAG: 4Fe-4S dicluster domain-containing protein [Trueperaceae bacterium]
MRRTRDRPTSATNQNPVSELGTCRVSDDDMTRRSFLKGVGKTAAKAVLGGAMLPPIVRFTAEAQGEPLRPPVIKHRWVMIFDLRLCDGCKDCTKACREMHFLPEELEFIKVYEVESHTGQTFFLPIACMMCQNAPCYRVCPTKATFYSEDGLVLIDQDKCIGCRACIAACPYDTRYFNFEAVEPVDPADVPWAESPEFPGFQKKGTVGKCAFCAHLLRNGELPACVTGCTMRAVYIGDWDKDLATNGRETVQLSAFLKDNDAFRFKEELNTQPSVYYIAGHAQNLDYYY